MCWGFVCVEFVFINILYRADMLEFLYSIFNMLRGPAAGMVTLSPSAAAPIEQPVTAPVVEATATSVAMESTSEIVPVAPAAEPVAPAVEPSKPVPVAPAAEPEPEPVVAPITPPAPVAAPIAVQSRPAHGKKKHNRK
jgi:hypothetical protein